MPSWGRPPGAKGNKQRKKWEKELWMEEQGRIQELDSEDSETRDFNYEAKRFSSDSLQFTGLELSSKARPRRRRRHAYDRTDSDSQDSRSGTEDDGNESEVSQRQISLRDKEEALVQSALARIRRAHEKGKREVKLNSEELEALERRRKRLQSAGTATDFRKGGADSGGSGSDRKRRSDRALITVPIGQLQPRRHSDKYRGQSPTRSSSGPAVMVDGPDGIMYAPIGHYPSKRDSPTRPRSSTTLGHPSRHASDLYASEYDGRRISDDMRPTSAESSRMPLPHDEGWTPDSRRSSISSRYPYDPFEYQTSAGDPPSPPVQGQGGRRNVSGPPQVSYSALRRSPPTGNSSLSSRDRISDPALDRRRREEGVPESDDDRSYSDEESDDPSRGGVSVEPERPITVVPKKHVGGSTARRKGRR